MARRSTAVEPEGTQTMTRGLAKAAAVVHLADEMLDHLFRDFEIGDDAVPQGSDGFDVAGCTAEHQLGLVADRQNLLAAALIDNSDHRRFIENDAACLDVDQSVGGSEIDRHIGRHYAENI